MSRALVLNATYEPLCLVAARRAVVLVMRSKAEILREHEDPFHSALITVASPSVVRLTHYVRVPHRRRATLSRRAVLMRDGYRCEYCGGTAESVDHVVPRSKGGRHTWDNVVAACRRCNSHKEDRLPREAGMRLRSRPAPPADFTWLAARVGRIHPHWEEYLVPSSATA